MQQFQSAEIQFTPIAPEPVPAETVQSEPPPPDDRERLWPKIPYWKHWLVALALFSVVALAFSNSFKSGMALDNKYIIEEYFKTILRNDKNFDLMSWRQIGLLFQNDYWWPKGISGLYRPITTFTYWLDYVVLTGKPPKTDAGGRVITGPDGKPVEMTWHEFAYTPGRKLDTWSYHTINMIVHWLNGLLLYFVALLLFKRLWPAAVTAALFLAHPVTTESVTNIIGRADMFAGIATFGGLLLYVRSTRNSNSWSLPWLMGLLLLTAFGLFAKESSAAVVLVLIAYDIAFRWRRDNPEVKGLLPLIVHGLGYLATVGGLVGVPIFVSWMASKHGVGKDWALFVRAIGALVPLLAGLAFYVVVARGEIMLRVISLAALACFASIACVFIPYYPLLATVPVVFVELFRASLTSTSPRFRVVGHATLYLALSLFLIGLPVGALLFFHHQRLDEWFPGYEPILKNVIPGWRWAIQGFLAFGAGLFLHLATIKRDRMTRAVALVVIVLAIVVASFCSYWLGILLGIIVGLHEVILCTLGPDDPEYRRDWKTIWHGFAIGYLAVIPALVAMFVVRAWVFGSVTPPEEPFLDNPIRGIWKVQELNIPAFNEELVKKPMYGMTFWECRMTAVRVMGELLLLLAWPWTLCSDYSYSEIANFSWRLWLTDWRLSDWAAVISLLALIGIGWVTVKLYNRSRVAFFLILFFFAAALPTSNFFITIGSIMAERFMYLPLGAFVGIFVLVTFKAARWLYAKLGEDDFAGTIQLAIWSSAALVLVAVACFMWGQNRVVNVAACGGVLVLAGLAYWYLMSEREPGSMRWHEVTAVFFLTCVTIVYGIRAYARNFVWQSDRTLWEAAIIDSPRSFRCYQSLAFALYEENAPANVDRMIAIDEAGIRLVDSLPNHLNSSRMYLHLGMYYAIKGDLISPRDASGRPLTSPQSRPWYEKSAAILERGAEVDRAFNELNRHKQIRRGDPQHMIYDAGLNPIYTTLALAYDRLGTPEVAIQRLQYARQLDPNDVEPYMKLASILYVNNRYEDAIVALIESMLLEPGRTETWTFLHQAFSAMGEPAKNALEQEGNQIRLNMKTSPLVRQILTRVYVDLIRVFLRSNRYVAADETRKAARRQYDWMDIKQLDDVFNEPVPVVTPAGVSVDHLKPPLEPPPKS